MDYSNELHSFDLSKLIFKTISQESWTFKPLTRNFHSTVLYNDHIFVFGGKYGGYLNDLLEYSIGFF
jgi:hypothetical protein